MKRHSSKHLLSILLSLSLVLGILPMYAVSAASDVNAAIVNPGLEMDLVEGNIPGWSKDATTIGLIELSTTVAKSGSKSLHLHDTDSGTTSPGLRVMSDKIAVTPGKTYTVTASVYVIQQTANIVHEVRYYNVNDVEISPTQQVLNSKTALTVNAWNEIKNVSTAPTAASYARIGFYSGKPSLTNAYFDDISFELETPVTPSPTPTASPSPSSSPSPTPTVSPGPIQNLGFEMDLVNNKIPGWSLVATTMGTLEPSTVRIHSGSKSLFFKEDSATTRLQVISDAIPVISSKSYTAKAYVNVVSQSHSIGYEVHYFNDQGAKVGDATFLNFSAAQLGTNQWTEMSVPFTVPTGVSSVKLLFNSGVPSITEAYFDDASIELVTPVTPSEIPNEILNPGFEQDLVNGSIPDWTIDSATVGLLEQSTVKSRNGSKSLHFHDNGAVSGLRVFSSKIAVIPGKSYIAKGFVNVIQQTHNIVYEIYYYDDKDAQIGLKQELFGELALGKNIWSEMRVFSDAPVGAAYAKIAFYSGGISLTEAYFDDVSFEVVPADVPLDRQYGAPTDLGPMVSVSLGQAGAIQQNSLGENEVYFHSNGLPGTFSVLDAETGTLKFSEVIPNTEALWAMTIGPDKNVYFAGTGDGKLYRYLPALKRSELLGANHSDPWVWDLEATPDGKIYGGTFKDKGNGKLFEYDIATNTFRDYGTVMQGQDYVRGIGVDNEYIYAGLGTNVHLFKVHRVTGQKTEINIPGYTGTTGTIADVFIVNNKLFVSVSTVNMVVMNMDTYEIEHTFQYSNMISKPYPANPDLIFYKDGTKFYQYDFSTNKSSEIAIPLPLPDTTRVKDMQWIQMKSGVKAGKTVLAIVTQYGEYILYDPADNWLSFVELKISAQPVRIQAIETGPMDGRLYLGGYQRGMSIYNPFTNKIDLNISSFAQPEGIGFLNDHVYYGTYVSAIMYRYDPALPASLNVNPKLVYDIQHHQDRPFAIASGDNKLFVGTVADYGVLGGVLAVYDEAKDVWTQFNDVVADQSIIGLAYKDGLLYGSTTVWGGLGSVPTQTEAKIFVWDVAAGKKVDEFTPVIPGIDEAPKMIGELSFGPDGYLWGAVDGTIFGMDVTTKEIVKSKVIRPSLYNTSKWKPYRLKWSPDGLLYTTLSRKLIVVDPETLAYKIISDTFVNDMTLGIDGSIYYAPEAGTALSRIAVPETDATLAGITVNGTPLEGFSPGVLKYTLQPSSEAVIQGSAAQAGATVTTENELAEKQTIIRVTATDGKSTLVYKLNWSIVDPGNPTDPINPVDPVIPTAPTDTSDPNTQTINESNLQGNGQGVVSIQIDKGMSSLLLPANAATIVGEQSVVLKNDDFTINIAPEVLKQLQQLAYSEELQNAQIQFSFDKISDPAKQDLLSKATTSMKANITDAGEVFEFDLSIVTKDGKSLKLTAFDKPIKITMHVNKDTNEQLVGIYFIANDGTLSYAGGKLENGLITADIHHFSKYAVLEVDKSFIDVPTSHWADNVIKSMAAKLIAQGVSDTEFAPEKSVTRAEFASLITRSLGLDTKGSSIFTDVEAGAWYTSAVAAAY
ncbi:MAG: hypothetical protein K0Q73_6015, partial [Paenibacillus sp.]|nr:hypothetical protein [Paenibacillus sp.]